MVVVVLALGLVLSGTAVTLVLRNFMVSRLDEGISGFATRMAERPAILPPPPPSAPANRGPAMFSIAQVGSDGTVTSADANLSGVRLPDLSTITPGVPFTASDAESQWRAVLVTRDSGYLLIAASLTEVNATVGGLIRGQVAVDVVVVLLGGLIGYALVSRRVRPLADMAAVTDEIAAGDLQRRVTGPPGSAEVAHLATSFNTMVDELETALSTARAREEQMRRFVGDAGHELRTPLTSIRGFAELATSGAADPTSALARIESEAARMGVLIEELLTLARMDAQRPLSDDDVDLSAVVRDRADRFTALHDAHPLSISVQPNVHVRGDAMRLAQVVDILLANTAMHTPAETRVDLGLVATDAGVVLRVADQGSGMAPEVAVRVFERFYRGDSSRTRATGGSGLGLAIAEALVSAHGGMIEVESAVGVGSTFTVTLPGES